MKKFKARYYSYAAAAAIIFFMSGCTKQPGIIFCEGASPDGKGVKCGLKFSTGDVTALIKPNADLSGDSLTLRILDTGSHKNDRISEDTVTPGKNKKNIIYSVRFENPGTYKVIALQKEKIISEGTIEIVE